MTSRGWFDLTDQQDQRRTGEAPRHPRPPPLVSRLVFSEPLSVYIITALAVVIIGIAKAGFGGGVGFVAIPMMVLVMDPVRAAAVLLPLLILCDFFSFAHWRKTFDKRNVLLFLPGALVGILLGWIFFDAFRDQERILKTGIGVLAISFVLFQVTRESILSHIPPFKPDWRHGLGLGAAAGFTSTLAHAAGPIAVIFLLPQRLDKKLFVGTTVVIFTVVNLVKLIPYYFLDQLTTGNLGFSLLFVPLVPLGVWLGITLHKRVDDTWFNRIIYILVFFTGLDLIGLFRWMGLY